MRVPASAVRSIPPIFRESRVAVELAALRQSEVFREIERIPSGTQPVLLIPGLLAGDDSLGVMTDWLRRGAHRTRAARARYNVDCSSAVLEPILVRLEELAEREGERVVIVGQSRGGTLARVAAVRRPDLVAGIVTLGSPLRNPLSLHPLLALQVVGIGLLGTAGVQGLFRLSCLAGSCCRDFRSELVAPFPPDVRFLSLYSKTDGLVRWRSCLDPDAEHHEVDSSHVGMNAHPEVYRVLAAALGAWDADETLAPVAATRQAA